jgi:hypothetical protein
MLSVFMLNVVMMSVVAPTPIVWINKLKCLYLETFFRQVQCFQGRRQGILKGGSITVPLTSCSTGLYWSVLQIKTKIANSQTADSKQIK